MEHRGSAREALSGRRPAAESECAVQHLPGSTRQEVQEAAWLRSRTAHCCLLAIEEADESGEDSLLPLLSWPSSDPGMDLFF